MATTPEFLERDAQMSRLRSAFEAAARGAGRLVAIEGEAGIGKTTLVQRFADAHRTAARVYRGGCEHLSTPEPLCPLRDIARQSQGRFAFAAGSDGVATFDALLRMLAGGPGPALLVLEDLHWADAPTLDFVRYLGRRIAQIPALALVTVRTDGSAAHEQVAALWPEIPRDNFERVLLDPLSFDAVSRLAAATGRNADELYAATRGNPFFVSEALAAPADVTPSTVRDATLLRMRRLSAPAARVLEAASIFPRQVEYETLAALTGTSEEAAIDECMRAGMLEERQGMLAFRHELARRVIEESLAPRRRRSMHQEAIAALARRAGIGAARLAHHAEHAGDVDALLALGRRAADEAAALGAHREATAQLARVLLHSSGISDAERASILERHAEEGELSGDATAAARSIEEAWALRRRGHDTLGLGNALRIASRLHWQLGDRAAADDDAVQAISALNAHPRSWQLAMALSNQSQLDMLADRFEQAIDGGARAMRLAEALGRWDIYLHAWTNVASARSSIDAERGYAELLDAVRVADERGLPDYVPRLYVNLCYNKTHERHYDRLFEHLDDGIARCVERDNAPLEAYLQGVRAAALLDRGRLHEAAEEAERVVVRTSLAAIPRFPAVLALSRVRARRGLPGAAELLAEERTLTAAGHEPQRYTPIAVADAEAYWLGEERPHAPEQLRRAYAELTRACARTWMIGEAALWLHVLGFEVELPRDLRRPLLPAHALHIEGRWRDAAEAWRALGCPFEEALALREGDEAAQRAALAIFERIGAAAAAQRLRREMRARGVRAVPAGPRAATRGNPAGLTSRQMQVLTLMAAGLDNAEIGARLHISAKTAEHHVGAVLAAFGASTRQRAVEAARARGVLRDDGES